MSTKDGQNEAEQGFNDSELLDIMQEIESLEREFTSSDGETAPEELAIEADAVKKTDLQSKIDEELVAKAKADQDSEQEQASADEEFEELDQAEAEMEAESVVSDNVVTMTPKSASTAPHKSTSTTNAPMSFSAEGSMNLSLEFNLGGAVATLHVNGEEGVTFEMDGVTLTLHPEEGCQVSMAQGVKFSVPLGAQTSAKKAA